MQKISPAIALDMECNPSIILEKINKSNFDCIISTFPDTGSFSIELDFLLRNREDQTYLFNIILPELKHIEYAVFEEIFLDSINDLTQWMFFVKEKKVSNSNSLYKINISPRVPREYFVAPVSFSEQDSDSGALSKSEKRLNALFELAPDAMTITSLTGRVKQVNKAFVDITGIPRDENEGKHFLQWDFLKQTDRSYYSKVFSQIFKNGLKKPFEFRWVTREGATRYGEVTAKIIKVIHLLSFILMWPTNSLCSINIVLIY